MTEAPRTFASRPVGPDTASTPEADGTARLLAEVRRQVIRYCPARVRNRLEDIVQTAWLRLETFARKGGGPPGSSLISKVAFCAAMDECRRLRRQRETALDDAAGDLPAEGSGEPADAVRAREIRHALADCLSSMSERRGLAVTLYLQGHSIAETAGLLGWTHSTAQNLVFRGLGDLRRCLGDKGVTP